MSRRTVTRAVCAPLMIVIAATAVLPSAFHYSPIISEWISETVPATLASLDVTTLGPALERRLTTSADVEQPSADINTPALESAPNAVGFGEDILNRVSAAAETISRSTDAALARVDGAMTSLAATVLAALPGGGAEPAPTASVVDENPWEVAESAPHDTLSISVVVVAPPKAAAALSESAAPQPARIEPAQASAEPAPLPEIKKAAPPAHADKSVLASLGIVDTATAAPAPAQAPLAIPMPAPEVKAIIEEKFALAVDVKAAPETKPAVAAEVTPVPEAKPVRVAEIKPVPDVKPLPEARPAPAAELNAVREETPAPVAEVKAAREEKPQEKPQDKQVFASLGRQAVDTPPPSPSQPAVEAMAAPEPDTPPAESEISHFKNTDVDETQSIQMAISKPLTFRALTRADIPSQDKLASLGSPMSDTRNMPAEQQRVAYDAPVVLDAPTSIGRRKWIDEASKYQGLGSPEALLEALRHMGAGAKSLGLPGSLWCADFMNLVLRKSGLNTTGSRAARSYLQYGKKIDEPRVGAIAIFSRGRNSGHIGIVRGTDGNGNPIIISGNHNNKVAEAVYPKSRVLAYVVPK